MIDRALPAGIIDLIRDGVPDTELRRHGRRAIYRALLRTGMSAQHRGWTQVEWEVELMDVPGKLGEQIRIKVTGAGRPQNASRSEIRKLLDGAWERAWELRTSDEPWTKEQLATTAASRAAQALAASTTLPADQALVLRFAAAEAARRGLTRIPLPWRAVAEATGLNPRRTREAIQALVDGGHVVLAVHGLPLGPRTTLRRANLYDLVHREVPVNGTVDQPLSMDQLAPVIDIRALRAHREQRLEREAQA